jgi:hypothetical protein
VGFYYEAHVTIEPVFDARLEQFKEIAAKHDFRVADLLMKKREGDTAEQSQYDSFCTGRSEDIGAIRGRVVGLCFELRRMGFTVWRYKIEDTIIDSRHEDQFLLLSDSELGLGDAPDH